MNLAFIVTVLAILFYFYIKRQRKSAKVDYSFGLKNAKQAKENLVAVNYGKTEILLNQMDADDLTQTIDFLTLSMPESVFTDWHNYTKSDLSQLCLGVFYGHQAWIARSNEFAKNVSETAAEVFFDYNQKAKNLLESMPEKSNHLAEAYARLIRISMADGDMDSMYNYYQKSISIDPKRLWPYLHYCEAIQPKWGGDIERITELMKNLPDEPIVQHGVMLKLLSDSDTLGDNYFPNQATSLEDLTKNVVQKIDEDISKKPLTSIHKYVIYNYLWLLSQNSNLAKTKNKYGEMMQGFLTLYPFGIKN